MFSGGFRTFGGSFSAVWTATIARVGAFCSVFQTVQDSPTKSEEFCNPSHQFSKFRKIVADFYVNFLGLSSAKAHKSCKSRKMLKNAPSLAIVAVHTAENELLKV